MNRKTCEGINEFLVEYADGDLSGAEAREVETHLAECPECQSDLRLLRRSLELAQVFWQDRASDTPSLQFRPVPTTRRKLLSVIALASCLVLAALTLGPWLISRYEPDVRRIEPSNGTSRNTPAPVVESDVADDLSIETMIAREAQSARLAASARFLATQPALKEYKKQADLYVIETYGNTIAGRRRAQENEDL